MMPAGWLAACAHQLVEASQDYAARAEASHKVRVCVPVCRRSAKTRTTPSHSLCGPTPNHSSSTLQGSEQCGCHTDTQAETAKALYTCAGVSHSLSLRRSRQYLQHLTDHEQTIDNGAVRQQCSGTAPGLWLESWELKQLHRTVRHLRWSTISASRHSCSKQRVVNLSPCYLCTYVRSLMALYV